MGQTPRPCSPSAEGSPESALLGARETAALRFLFFLPSAESEPAGRGPRARPWGVSDNNPVRAGAGATCFLLPADSHPDAPGTELTRAGHSEGPRGSSVQDPSGRTQVQAGLEAPGPALLSPLESLRLVLTASFPPALHITPRHCPPPASVTPTASCC